ncbi:hypothetical protein [Mycolicibacterium sp.]|uniref:hypothetical protein n=1 Tax=Mycolicibacterium sp. TaxID=2320850 RepID=UPI001A2F2C36|nr:hypothetical protein [Mycolicibacterium sp.]MBJ7339569.1 hypothetical protein [Mycolicibacterium sp.]
MTALEGTDMPDHDTTPAEDAIPAAEATTPEATPGVVIRHVLERQLVAGQGLGTQLVGASTEISVALVHAPVTVIDEIRSGATLPAALAQTRSEVQVALSGAGTRVRTAIGEYVSGQATLPHAVVRGAADVAEAVLRGQGTVAGSALDSAFTVATIAARGGDVAEALDRERRDVAAHADAARTDVAESWERAVEEIRGAVKDYDEE